MQTDYHLGIVYLLSKWAGFCEESANIVALCSRFVDDNEENKILNSQITFNENNLYVYKPLYSSRGKFDSDNLYNPENASCWPVFHFLPCCYGSTEYEKLLCKSDGNLISEMLNECINKQDLYRLGITLHVLADSYSHEGFAGVKSSNNKVALDKINITPMNEFIKAKILGRIAQTLDPLGHAGVYLLPDIPYVTYSYTDYTGKDIKRNNLQIYLNVSNKIFQFLQEYNGVKATKVLTDEQKKSLLELLQLNLNDPMDRLEQINKYTTDNDLGNIPSETLIKWRNNAEDLAATSDYDGFLNSHYFKFNEAVKAHKSFILSKLNLKKVFIG